MGRVVRASSLVVMDDLLPSSWGGVKSYGREPLYIGEIDEASK